MRKYISMLLPMLMVAAAVAVACGGGDSKTVSIPGGGEVSVSDKLPDSFPKDYPIYDGAKVKGSLSGTTKGISGTTVTWETGDSLSKVTDFYTNAFKSGNWKTDSNGQVNDSSYWSGESSDGKKSHYILVSTQGDKTNIIVTVGDKQADNSSSSDDSNKTSASSSSSETATTSSDSSSDSGSSSSSATVPAEVKITKDFPTDRVPFPSGARVTSSASFGSGGSKTYSVELYVKDTPENVSDYFSGELPKHGWATGFTSNSNGEYLLTFAKDGADATSGEAVTVSAMESDVSGYTKVDLVVTTSGT
jgi:hypothetical protein